MSTNNAANIPVPVPVAYGGTGNTTFTPYSLVCAGTTSTGTLQNVAGVGTAGQVLTSNGTSALPSWQTGTGSGTGNITFSGSTISTTSSIPAITISPYANGSLFLQTPNIYMGQSGSAMQVNINSGTGSDTCTFTLTSGVGVPTGFNFATNATDISPSIYFLNNTGGTSYLGIKAPDMGTLQNASYTLPGTFSTIPNQLLACNASGFMSWIPLQFNWIDNPAPSAALFPGANYVPDYSSLVTFTLPTSSSFGDTYQILGKGAGGWRIAQNAGQNIQFGNISTTLGTGGSLSSTNQYDAITLVCTVANTTWGITSSVGNITIV